MRLCSITIKNFRSIEEETFDIVEVDGTYTFTLIGINESGKSSFLKAISLIDNDDEIIPSKDSAPSHNAPFAREALEESIEKLRELKYGT